MNPPSIHIEPPADEPSDFKVDNTGVSSAAHLNANFLANPSLRTMFMDLYPGAFVSSSDPEYPMFPSSSFTSPDMRQETETYFAGNHISGTPLDNSQTYSPGQSSFDFSDFDMINVNMPRVTPTDPWETSPYSVSSGEVFSDDGYSPSSIHLSLGDNASWHSSPDLSGLQTGTSPSLSPITATMNDFTIADNSLPNDVIPSESRPIFRSRSVSASEGTVAPREIWADSRNRSASFNTAASRSADAPYDMANLSAPSYNFEMDDSAVADDDFAGLVATSPFDASYFTLTPQPNPVPDVQQYLGPCDTVFANNGGYGHLSLTPTETVTRHRHSASAPNPSWVPSSPQTSSAPFTYDSAGQQNAAPSNSRLMIQTNVGLRPDGHRRSRSHSGHTLSPDDALTRGRLVHRTPSSTPGSRRHSPYPTSPSSDGSRPTSPFDRSVSRCSSRTRGYTVGDEHSDGSLRPQMTHLSRAVSNPEKATRYGPNRRRGQDESPNPGGILIGRLGKAEQPELNVPGPSTGRMLPTYHQDAHEKLAAKTDSADFKAIVASQKILDASVKRRSKPAPYACDFEGCTATFTAKHNLQNHINSHNGLKPYVCPGCHQAFGTQGVLSRHSRKCRSAPL